MNRMIKIIGIFLITAWILPLHARDMQCDPLKPDKAMLGPVLQRLVRAGKCRSVIRRVVGYDKRLKRRLKRTRKKCKPDKLNRVITQSVYKAWPNAEPGVTDMITAPGPAMAVAWCQCRAGRYEQAMKTLERYSLFGWDADTLPAYAYMLGMLTKPENGILLLATICKPDDQKCRKIMDLLKAEKAKKENK